MSAIRISAQPKSEVGAGLAKVAAIFRRDVIVALSYPGNFALSWLGIVVEVLTVNATKTAIEKRSPAMTASQVSSAQHVLIAGFVVSGVIAAAVWIFLALERMSLAKDLEGGSAENQDNNFTVSGAEQLGIDIDVADLFTPVVKGKGFDMVDLKSQLEQLQKMGGVGALLDKLPAAATQKAGPVNAEQGDRDLRRQIAIINSMTRKERRNPGIIDGSRRRRIATGSGVQVQDVNRLLKQFMEMQRVMKSMKGGKLRQLMSALKRGGGGPPGFPGQ